MHVEFCLLVCCKLQVHVAAELSQLCDVAFAANLQGDYETAASLYKRSTEIKESASASGQVTPRRTSTYDPAAPLRSAGPNAPRALLLTQHDQ